jgi:hypothetical protein
MRTIKVLLLAVLVVAVMAGAGYAAQRVALAELFTSTTCSPCVAGNANLTAITKDHFLDLAVIRYHMNWPAPGTDPYYAANPTENGGRRRYYWPGSAYVPHLVCDGDTSEALDYGARITNALAVAAPAELNMSVVFDTLTRTGTLTWMAKATDPISLGKLRLRIAITESDLHYTGTNGDPVHEQVMRDMVPDTLGDTLTLIAAGDSVVRSTPFAINAGWVLDNCEIVAFIQSDSIVNPGRRRTVLQAVKSIFYSKLVLTSSSITENGGNSNGYIEPGENANLVWNVQNQGGDGIDASIVASESDPYVTLGNPSQSMSAVSQGDTFSNAAAPCDITVDPTTPNGHQVSIVITKSVTSGLTQHTRVTVDTLTFIVGVPVTGFIEDFEGDLSRWTRTGSGGTVNWDTTSATSHSSTHSMTDSRAGNYANSINRYIQLVNGIDLTAYNAATLSWWERYSTESGWDFCYPEYSRNNTTWTALVPGYAGSATTWAQRSVDITALCDTSHNFKVRFRLQSDGAVVDDGWYVDDIMIQGYIPTGVTGKPENPSATITCLLPCYPNPARGSVAFSYQLKEPGNVCLAVYDITGRLVQTLVKGKQNAGSHSVAWNGCNERGQNAASGVYFYKLTTGSYSAVKKLTMLK